MTKHLIHALKAGDKIICDKQYSHGSEYVYNECDVYNVIEAKWRSSVYPVYAEHEDKKYPAHGFTEKELENNWITLAEWRDKQINSILND
jgi:hypothetical protein